jgi:hypothetical protein
MCRAWASTAHDHWSVVLRAGPSLAFIIWVGEIISYRVGPKKVRPKHDGLIGTVQLSALHTGTT